MRFGFGPGKIYRSATTTCPVTLPSTHYTNNSARVAADVFGTHSTDPYQYQYHWLPFLSSSRRFHHPASIKSPVLDCTHMIVMMIIMMMIMIIIIIITIS